MCVLSLSVCCLCACVCVCVYVIFFIGEAVANTGLLPPPRVARLGQGQGTCVVSGCRCTQYSEGG